jgi:hypothetical protein
MLTLRANDFDGPDRRDFSVLQDGRPIGRIYESSAYLGRWVWALAGWGCKITTDVETAKAELKAQMERVQVDGRSKPRDKTS